MWCDTVDMRVYSNRVQTFQNSGWPHNFLSPETMANSGFYYLKRGDEVRCSFCKVEIMQWKMGDDPTADHKRYAPQCKFAQGAIVNSTPFDNNAEEQQNECGDNTRPPKKPIHQQYIHFATRLQSFEKWQGVLLPKHLASAGFFYEGNQDRTICFWCGGRLDKWRYDDDAWTAHARWHPKCEYVANVKGEYYAQMVKSESCVIRRADEVVDKLICKICFVRNCDICFTPCGHVFVCGKCAQSLKPNTCPVCRSSTSIMRLFFV
ncbi:iap-3 [Clostera anastomosis granulovirus B]|uniref:Iap-3 n=1 Tax=Clostera anastomosis granulovirus B TaxID=1986290 RepID=A0A0K0WSJ4_9BBAC|nr:iap-3 [Clostera anastomosis granulovirus B]AKS25432.1 iap-3 [Clostera anastomosis granulovirus B]